jgi:predicted nicotinamide N-methyase
MTVPRARRDARLRRYPLRRQRLPVAGGTLSIVTPGPGDWVKTGGWTERAQSGQEPPYWADIWPASVAVARWLCRRSDLAGRRVLDLGCGLGVPGAAAVRQGAEVLFCDLHADALAFAAFNAGEQRADGRWQTRQFDWHGEELQGAFDVVVLADVTYRGLHHRPILRQIQSALGHEGVTVHADPFRRESDGFLALARKHFACRTVNTDTHFSQRRVAMRFTFMARAEPVLAAWLDAATQDRPAGAAAEASR